MICTVINTIWTHKSAVNSIMTFKLLNWYYFENICFEINFTLISNKSSTTSTYVLQIIENVLCLTVVAIVSQSDLRSKTDRLQTDFRLNPDWLPIESRSNPDRLPIESRSTPDRPLADFRLTPDWLPIDSRLTPDWFPIDSRSTRSDPDIESGLVGSQTALKTVSLNFLPNILFLRKLNLENVLFFLFEYQFYHQSES